MKTIISGLLFLGAAAGAIVTASAIDTNAISLRSGAIIMLVCVAAIGVVGFINREEYEE